MKKLIFIPLLIFSILCNAQFTKSGGAFLKTGSSFMTASSGGNNFLTNLVAYWSLDEESGTINDSAGDNNSTACTADYGSIGINGDCLSFTAANSDHVTFADVEDLRMYDQDLTFVAWIYITDLPVSGAGYAILGGENSSAGMTIYTTLGQLKLVRVVTSFNTGGPVVSINNWHMIAVTFDNSETTNNLNLYYDGNVSTVSYDETFMSDRATRYIGRNAESSQQWYFNGLIDEVMIWKGRILTTSELGVLYNEGNGLFFTDFK